MSSSYLDKKYAEFLEAERQGFAFASMAGMATKNSTELFVKMACGLIVDLALSRDLEYLAAVKHLEGRGLDRALAAKIISYRFDTLTPSDLVNAANVALGLSKEELTVKVIKRINDRCDRAS